MKVFHLESSHLTPKVVLDHKIHHFEMTGVARPEDARSFFNPIIQWLEEYKNLLMSSGQVYTRDNPLVLKFNMEYFNSASAKFLYDVLEKFQQISQSGQFIRIDWIYLEEDDDVLEAGYEMAELLEMEFNYVPIKE